MARVGMLLLAMTFGAAGCFGGSAASSAPSQTTTPHVDTGSVVRWTISYGVGQDERHRREVSPCPTGATCKLVRDPHVTFSDGQHGWARIATRRLTCPVPAGDIHITEGSNAANGDYSDPARACEALGRLEAILKHQAKVICGCPAMSSQPGKAVAVVHARRIIVPLDFCTYCGRSTRTTVADLTTLQPQT
jgi:hypothetical protein